LACVTLGGFFAIIPLDFRGSSQTYATYYACLTGQICLVIAFSRLPLAKDDFFNMLKNIAIAADTQLLRRYYMAIYAFFIVILCSVPAVQSVMMIEHGLSYTLSGSATYFHFGGGTVAQRVELDAFKFIRNNASQQAIVIAPDFFVDHDAQTRGDDIRADAWKLSALAERWPYVECAYGIYEHIDEQLRRINLLKQVEQTGLVPEEIKRSDTVWLLKPATFARITENYPLQVLYQNEQWLVASPLDATR
ncbi:hypothetical protein LJC15_05925, partial [Desulfovibrio sp. OttesenSCG-928-G11]|nr:hypothetical protein [Desulfovibrio sp. OttesenSCG-928-G11]